MTLRLFRVGNQPEAVYMSRDGMMQLAISSDHPHFEALPLFLDAQLTWDRLGLETQAYLYVLADRWAARDERDVA